jgi:F-type H+-transporting ATPase subunit a
MENLDFGIHLIIPLFEVDGQVFGFTTTHINTFIIMLALTIFGLFVKAKLKKFETVPSTKFQVVIEALVDIFGNFTSDTMGANNKKFTMFYGPLFVFILVSNLSGIVGMRPPTADIATTFALSLMTFFMVHGFGIRKKGTGKYFKGLLLEPIPALLPLNLIGELATPISLSFRLFGNMLGGTIIMGLYYAMMPIWLKLGIPAVFHLYFDLFAGALQTFIFIMLSMTFVSSAMSE